MSRRDLREIAVVAHQLANAAEKHQQFEEDASELKLEVEDLLLAADLEGGVSALVRRSSPKSRERVSGRSLPESG
jgi:hypothetical protein